jgi:hypothetical protein
MFKQVVAIFGMPRSGTSWLGQIFDSAPEVCFRLEPIFSYAFKNQVDEFSTISDFDRFFKGIYCSDDKFMKQEEKRISGSYPSFQKDNNPNTLVFKTTRYHHILQNMMTMYPTVSVISIVRNPCGAINSWLNTPGEFPANASTDEEWRSGKCRKTDKEEFWGFDDWKLVTRLHQDTRAW